MIHHTRIVLKKQKPLQSHMPIHKEMQGIQMVNVFDTLGWEDCAGTATVVPVKTANKSSLRL